MVHDPQNDLNVAGKPEHQQLLGIFSKRLREKFPVQEFKEPAVPAKKAKRAK